MKLTFWIHLVAAVNMFNPVKSKLIWNEDLQWLPFENRQSLFMKQNCQIQMGIVQRKNVAIPLDFLGINTTHQHFQMRYVTCFLA